MKDLLTYTMVELLPFFKAEGVDLKTGLMLVDLQLCSVANSSLVGAELADVVECYKELNTLLYQVLNPYKAGAESLFDNELIEKVGLEVMGKFLGDFTSKRTAFYQAHFPEVLTLLEQLKQADSSLAA